MDKDDIVDIIAQTVKNRILPSKPNTMSISESQEKTYKSGFFTKQRYLEPYKSKNGRPFISEYDLKQMLKKDPTQITIPKDAIISPLAYDIIQEKSIKINYVV